MCSLRPIIITSTVVYAAKSNMLFIYFVFYTFFRFILHKDWFMTVGLCENRSVHAFGYVQSNRESERETK